MHGLFGGVYAGAASSSPATPASRARGSRSGSPRWAPRSPATRWSRPRPRRSSSSLGVERRIERHIIGDVRDAARLRAAMARGAARGRVPPGRPAAGATLLRAAGRDFATNVMGTAHLSRRSAQLRDRAGGASTSRATSATRTASGVRLPRGRRAGRASTPTARARAAAELVTAAYRRSFFGAAGARAIATARAGNVIGGGDWAADRIVPDCIRALTAGEPIAVRNPDAVRPWQHVLEPLGGYLLLAQRLLGGRRRRLRRGLELRAAAPRRDRRGQLVDGLVAAWGSGSWETPAVGRAAARGALAEAGRRQGASRAWLAARVGRRRDRSRELRRGTARGTQTPSSAERPRASTTWTAYVRRARSTRFGVGRAEGV